MSITVALVKPEILQIAKLMVWTGEYDSFEKWKLMDCWWGEWYEVCYYLKGKDNFYDMRSNIYSYQPYPSEPLPNGELVWAPTIPEKIFIERENILKSLEK